MATAIPCWNSKRGLKRPNFMQPATKARPHLSHADMWTRELMKHGWCIIPDLMPVEKVHALHADLGERFEHTPFCEGDFYGRRTKRFGGLLKRSAHMEAFARHPTILEIADHALLPYCDNYQINLAQALALYPGAPMQAPHRDQDMWRGPTGEIEYLINVMWPFTDYREDNGATVVWPGSHHHQYEDPADLSGFSVAEMDPGSALVFLGSTLHGAGANRSVRIRKGMVISYCLGWLKPYENQWLAYPPSIARSFLPNSRRWRAIGNTARTWAIMRGSALLFFSEIKSPTIWAPLTNSVPIKQRR